MVNRPIPAYKDLPRGENDLYPNAWGIFGDDDQLGTLNHLSPERVLNALKSVETGQVVSLNLALDEFDPPLIAHRGIPKHEIFGLNDYHRDDRIDNLFLQASTQLDSLRHFGHPDKGFYNGVQGEKLVVGEPDLGIQHVANKGIVGRGLLIDLEAYFESKGAPIDFNSGQTFSVDDLEAALEFQGSAILPGDILLIHTGWLKAIRNPGYERAAVLHSPGLLPDETIAEWLWNKQVAIAASDNLALEAWPSQKEALPTLAEQDGNLGLSSHTGMLHRLLIPLLGLTIGELWDLTELAALLRVRNRYDCLISAEPLNIPGGVGSPANALAII
jgi:kynurenine formamidase